MSTTLKLTTISLTALLGASLLVACGDDSTGTVDAVDRVAGRNLAGFIEDDDVELDVRWEVLRHRERAHHEDRVDRLDDVARVSDEFPHRQVTLFLLRLTVDQRGRAA